MLLLTRERVLFWAVALGLLVQGLVMYPHMPPRMATSFSVTGQPEGWMSVSGCMWFEFGLVGVLWLAFLVLPRIVGRFPNSINMPNRDYWLAPSRRGTTLADLERRLNGLGVIVLVLVGVMMDAIFRANVSVPVRLSPSAMWVLLGLYLSFMLVWTVRFTRRYRRV